MAATLTPVSLKEALSVGIVGDDISKKAGLSDFLQRRARGVIGKYSFATQGGAVSSISLKDEKGANLVLPSGSILIFSVLNIKTTLTSGGSATVKLTLEASGDMSDSSKTAVANWTSGVGSVSGGGAAGPFKLTADRTLILEIGTAALTAGLIEVVIMYCEPDTA